MLHCSSYKKAWIFPVSNEGVTVRVQLSRIQSSTEQKWEAKAKENLFSINTYFLLPTELRIMTLFIAFASFEGL